MQETVNTSAWKKILVARVAQMDTGFDKKRTMTAFRLQYAKVALDGEVLGLRFVNAIALARSLFSYVDFCTVEKRETFRRVILRYQTTLRVHGR